MDPIFYAFVILIFVAVVLAVEGVYLWWNSSHGATARRIESRIRVLSAGGHIQRERLTILKDRMLRDSTYIEKLVMSVPRLKSLDLFIQQSGVDWSVTRLVVTSLAIPFVVFAAALVAPVPLRFGAAIALATSGLPYLHVNRKRAKRLAKLERQLPDVADTIGRALRAGHSFPSAIGMISTEFAEPMSGEFRITFDEINYGVPLGDALLNLAKRVPIRDLRYFVIAVLIQRETGGNLAEVLDGIAFLIRERFKLFDKVRVLAAEGKMSAWVLGLLPFVTAGAMMALNREFLAVLWEDPAGLKVVYAMISMMVSGAFWMRRIIKIRV
ncbi:tight adherence protein B [Trinickia symbiotica]|uniref:Pilus assembly protein TadB n=1 Tax=Trinickia symbiotica TaxID=863227 RepID=A0A2N7XAM9_9BURK|nr:type II secretion system F family protein [Trinickia symbiotica]PMS38671.1 pilus assembly protein TadB [Trinickia symbiotica]PPK46686.1 tight adherence protein B [Trinickia symbiotica]